MPTIYYVLTVLYNCFIKQWRKKEKVVYSIFHDDIITFSGPLFFFFFLNVNLNYNLRLLAFSLKEFLWYFLQGMSAADEFPQLDVYFPSFYFIFFLFVLERRLCWIYDPWLKVFALNTLKMLSHVLLASIISFLFFKIF